MHVPDGFLDLPTSVATASIAVGAVGLALHQADAEIRRTGPALAGLTSAFVFAVQMVNFPVGAGTSGHLLGGALAAALVGPWTAVLCLSVVLLVQALLFADGGLTALGTNITLMAVVTVVVGYAVTRGLLRVLPRRPRSVLPAVAAGAFLSVPAAALLFAGLYAVGGTVAVPLPLLTASMVGWHLLIGVGEAVITTAVLGAVLAGRPDLVSVAAPLRPQLVLVAPDGSSRLVDAMRPEAVDGSRSRRPLVAAGLTTLLVAGVVSLTASASPDGLEYVAGTVGLHPAVESLPVVVSPLAGYAVHGLDSVAATSMAGVAGVLVTLAFALAVARVSRRRAASGSGV